MLLFLFHQLYNVKQFGGILAGQPHVTVVHLFADGIVIAVFFHNIVDNCIDGSHRINLLLQLLFVAGRECPAVVKHQQAVLVNLDGIAGQRDHRRNAGSHNFNPCSYFIMAVLNRMNHLQAVEHVTAGAVDYQLDVFVCVDYGRALFLQIPNFAGYLNCRHLSLPPPYTSAVA